MTGVLTLALVGAAVWGTGGWRQFAEPAAITLPPPLPPEVVAEPSSLWPPVPDDASPQRLLAPVSPGSQGTHAFVAQRTDGEPVRYDACRPLHYVVNPDGMPDGGLRLVREAVASLSSATGLVLTEDGVSDEALSTAREPHQPDRYGDRWAPVLIGWSDGAQYPLLGGEIAGVAGSQIVTGAVEGSDRYVTGYVALDRQDFTEILGRPDGFEQARAIVMHEIGHLAGLDHVADAAQLMNAENSGQLDWGPGDRQGLAALGAGPCHTDT